MAPRARSLHIEKTMQYQVVTKYVPPTIATGAIAREQPADKTASLEKTPHTDKNDNIPGMDKAPGLNEIPRLDK